MQIHMLPVATGQVRTGLGDDSDILHLVPVFKAGLPSQSLLSLTPGEHRIGKSVFLIFHASFVLVYDAALRRRQRAFRVR